MVDRELTDKEKLVLNTFGCDNDPVAYAARMTEEALAQKVTNYDSMPYSWHRAGQYPAIADQLDMLWHAIDVGDWTAAKVKTTSFYTELKAVKDANPKP